MESTKITMTAYRCKLVKEKSFKYEGESISCGSDAAALFRRLLNSASEEIFAIACLDAKGKVIGLHEVSRGELSSCPVHPREVFKRAILNNASTVILSHNHPSGDTTPSDADITLTKRMQEAGELLGVKVLDHIIIDALGFGYTSLLAEGYICD